MQGLQLAKRLKRQQDCQQYQDAGNQAIDPPLDGWVGQYPKQLIRCNDQTALPQGIHDQGDGGHNHDLGAGGKVIGHKRKHQNEKGQNDLGIKGIGRKSIAKGLRGPDHTAAL